jgi:type II secretory pathway component PulF
MGQALPPITILLMSITKFLADYKWFILVAVIAVVAAVRRFVRTTEGRTLYDRALLRMPVLGDVVHKRELSRFARTLGNLLRNGVPILPALEITREVISNTIIRREVEKLPGSISQGVSMATTLSESPYFPGFMVSMIAVGEETAHVDSVLLKTAQAYEGQADRSLKTLTATLEPLIILALGVVVGFIVIAMMLPIMSLDPMTGGE